jgi:hypothetical protein
MTHLQYIQFDSARLDSAMPLNLSRKKAFPLILNVLCMIGFDTSKEFSHPRKFYANKSSKYFVPGGKQVKGGERTGLPDFSWYKIPKREKYTKLPRTKANVHKL